MAGDTRNIRINVDVHGSKSGTDPARQLDDTADAAENLSVQVERSKKRVAELRQELIRVGNDRGVRKALRGEESWLRELTKIQLAGSAGFDPAIAAPTGRMPTMGAAIGGVVLGLAPWLPVLGAAVAGAVAGTIGTGGIAGGVLMAAKDQRVKAALSSFGGSVSREFFSGGEQFVQPIVKSLDILEGAVQDMNLPETFGKMAPFVTVIAEGFADLGRNVMPGLNAAFDRMAPFAEAAKEGLGELGRAVGTFADDVTSSEGAVQGLVTFFHFLNGAIVITGKTLETFSDIYGGMVDHLSTIPIIMQGVSANSPGFLAFWTNAGKGMRGVAEAGMDVKAVMAGVSVELGSSAVRGALDSLRIGMMEGAEAAGGLAAALGRTQNQFLAMASAEVAAEESFDRFTELVKENGKELDIDTAAGRANVSGLIEIARAGQLVTAQKFEETHSIQEATAAYDAHREKLIQTAIDAGFTRKEAEALAKEWMGLANLPDVVKKIIVDGYTTAGGQAALRALNAAKNAASIVFSGGGISRQVQEFADGGYVRGPKGAPQLAIVHGGEYVDPDPTRPGGRMGTQVVVSADPTMERRLTSAIMAALRFETHASTGGNVQQAMGRTRAVMA